MTSYVCVGAFHEGTVVLVNKVRGPDHVRGRWNLPGGKVEEGEYAIDAAARELQEETGIVVRPDELSRRVVLRGTDWEVYFFRVDLGRVVTSAAPRRTDQQEVEAVGIFATRDFSGLSHQALVENLRWIVPLMLDDGIHRDLVVWGRSPLTEVA